MELSDPFHTRALRSVNVSTSRTQTVCCLLHILTDNKTQHCWLWSKKRNSRNRSTSCSLLLFRLHYNKRVRPTTDCLLFGRLIDKCFQTTWCFSNYSTQWKIDCSNTSDMDSLMMRISLRRVSYCDCLLPRCCVINESDKPFITP